MDLNINGEEQLEIWLKVDPTSKEESEWEEGVMWAPAETTPRCRPLSGPPAIKAHVSGVPGHMCLSEAFKVN